MENKFKVKPNVFRIMHPFKGGPFDVVSAQVCFGLESAIESANAENKKLLQENEMLKDEMTNSGKFAQDQEDKIAELKAALEKAVEMSEFYAKARYNGYQASAQEDGGKKAREFLKEAKCVLY